MISTVEKIYSDIIPNDFNYKVTYESGEYCFVPHVEENRHYQEILEWVEKGGVIVDNGA